jgi:hypothetical protein
MAHYSVTLCLHGDQTDDLPAAISTAMAPFGETSSLDWDQGFLWDTWRIAGNDWPWFWLMPGCEDDPRLLFEQPYRGEPPDLPRFGHCSGGPRKLLDLSSEPELGAQLIAHAWDLWQQLTKDLSLTERASLSHVVSARHGHRRREDAEAAYQAFREHPVVQAFHAAQPVMGDGSQYAATPPIDVDTLSERFVSSREQFIESHLQALYGGTDLVTLDGWWIEMDGTANHGTCGSNCPHRPESFDQARRNASIVEGKARYLEELPGDVIVVALQGHC